MAHIHYYLNGDTESGNRLSPHLLYTGVVRDDPHWLSHAHSHPFCEVLYVLRGKGSVTFTEKTEEIVEGDIVIINEGEFHAEKSNPESPLHFIFLAVDEFQLEGLPKNCLIPKGEYPIISSNKYRYKIQNYFTDLISETSGRVEYYELLCGGLVQAIMVLILRIRMTAEISSASLSAECSKVKTYIETHYTSPINLESLSETVFISKHHLAHLFKQQTGISPIQYLIQKRIEEACRLLRETDFPIAEIAERVGYTNSIYFSQVFRKAKGVSPYAYRKLN